MDVTALHSHFFSGQLLNELIAVVGTKVWVRKNVGGEFWATGATVTADTSPHMASFIDRVFLVNGSDSNLEYNYWYWTATENTAKSPIANYIFALGNRLYLYGIQIPNGAPVQFRYKTRVWFSDPASGDTVTWGLEYGSDLTATAGSAVVTSATAKFITRNIKIGDPFFIDSSDVGNNRSKPYTVQSIDSETQITLTEEIANSTNDDIYWVGGNWFDVGSDSGDASATGIGLASNELILFKGSSVYRYNVAGEELRRIKDAPGTDFSYSIVNWGGFCYWFHSSGIYRTSGATVEKISNGISDVIENIDFNNTLVVGWVNQIQNTINFYVGTATLRDGETISNCVVTLDLNLEIWSLRSYDRRITAATNWTVDSESQVYIGDNNQGVFRLDTGTQFKTADIPFQLELYPIFPGGADAVVLFHRLRMYIENGPDVQIFYKLIYAPRYGVEGVWDSDENWRPLEGTQIGDRVDWNFPMGTRASGIKLKFVESGGDESFLIEKFTVYYSDEANS